MALSRSGQFPPIKASPLAGVAAEPPDPIKSIHIPPSQATPRPQQFPCTWASQFPAPTPANNGRPCCFPSPWPMGKQGSFLVCGGTNPSYLSFAQNPFVQRQRGE